MASTASRIGFLFGRTVYKGQHTDPQPSFVTRLVDDLYFHSMARELGQIVETKWATFPASKLEVALILDSDSQWYAASGTPHAIGMGETRQEALQDWADGVYQLRALAKDLHSPMGARTYKDRAALIKAFGSLG